MRLLIVLLLVLIAALQHKAWFSDVGYLAARDLERVVAQQRQRAEVLEQRNRLLTAEVLALKDGLDAVESRARSELGMIKKDETFYLVPDDG